MCTFSQILMLWPYPLLNKYKEYLLDNVIKSMKVFFTPNIVLAIMDESKTTMSKIIATYMCFYVAKYFVLMFTNMHYAFK